MMYHRASGSLILNLKDPSKVTDVIPNSRVVDVKGRPLTQVKLGLDEARVLRNLGINAPSPIRYGYDWPSRYPSPLKHQVTTSEFLTLYARCIVLNGMGSGKTLSLLWAADYLMRHGVIRSCVIIAPLSTLDAVWDNEIRSHLFHRTCAVAHGSKDKREKILASKFDFYILNHDGVKTCHDILAAMDHVDLWIVDEASAFRNATSDRYRALTSLVDNAKMLWLATGTPIPRAPTDAWGLAKLLKNALLPRYFSQFRNMTMTQLTQYKWIAKPDAYKTAYGVLQPGIRFAKSECLDLPPVTYRTYTVEMTVAQKRAYSSMHDELVIDAGSTTITAANAAAKLQKLVQVCTGGVYDEDKNVHTIDCAPRLRAMTDLVDASDNKVLLFAPFTSTINMLHGHLRKQNIASAIVDGSVSPHKRRSVFHQFQNEDELKVLVCHPRVAAHGLTLTRADTTIWFGPIFDLELFEQANNRMDRPGQNNKMTIAMIACNMMELGIYKVLEGKADFQRTILELYRQETK